MEGEEERGEAEVVLMRDPNEGDRERGLAMGGRTMSNSRGDQIPIRIRKAATSFWKLRGEREGEEGGGMVSRRVVSFRDKLESIRETLSAKDSLLVVIVDQTEVVHHQSPDTQPSRSQSNQGSRQASRPEHGEEERKSDDGVEKQAPQQPASELHLSLGLDLVRRQPSSVLSDHVDGDVDEEGKGEEGESDERAEDVSDEDPEGRETRRERDGSRRVERGGKRDVDVGEGGVPKSSGGEIRVVADEGRPEG